MKAPGVNNRLTPQTFEHELRENILPFWMQHTLDHENGGFYGAVSNDLQVHNEVDRSAVLCSRILWTFSTAARLYSDDAYLDTARWAYDYLSSRFWDDQYQGIYWSLDRNGRPVNDRKHTYAQAFSIYGLSAYYRVAGDPASLALAQRLFELIELHTFDAVHGGNIECRDRNWQALTDMRLSEKEIDSAKSMNTLLHLLEAYATLAQIWPDPMLMGKLDGLVRIFLDKVIDPQSYHQRLFFDERWNSLVEHISYSHDIETSWLLVEAAEVLGNADLVYQACQVSLKMAQAVHDQALNSEGSIRYEFIPDSGHQEDLRHWWAHAEAVVGFYHAYQLSGQAHFVQAAGQVWDYIQAHFIDRQHGDWFKRLNADGVPILAHPKVGPWDCPYHHARMCYEMMARTAKSPDQRQNHVATN